MVIPCPVGVDDQDWTPGAHPQTVAQRTFDTLRVPQCGQPVAPRQGPEAFCQALRGLRGGAVAVFTDENLAPVGSHAWGACLLCHNRSPSLDGPVRASWHRTTRTWAGAHTPPDASPHAPTGWIAILLPHLRVGPGGESGLRTPCPNPFAASHGLNPMALVTSHRCAHNNAVGSIHARDATLTTMACSPGCFRVAQSAIIPQRSPGIVWTCLGGRRNLSIGSPSPSALCR
jgi:hypothetical protein